MHDVAELAVPDGLAIVVLVTLAINCALIGLLLAQRGLSMLSDGLAHSAFGCTGLLLVLGLPLDLATWSTVALAPAIAALLIWLSARTKLPPETMLAVLFVTAMAIGVAALSYYHRSGGADIDVEAVMFGDLFGLSTQAAWAIIAGQFCMLLAVLVFGGRIAYAGFYPDMATLSGLRVKLYEYGLMFLAGLQLAFAAKAVGVLLASGFLVLPAATARLLDQRLGVRAMVAVVTSVLGVGIGYMACRSWSIPCSAAVALAQVCLFFMYVVGCNVARQICQPT